MFFSSIRTTLIALTISAILIASFSVLRLSVSEHENLYRETVKNEFEGLLENLASDLIPVMAGGHDPFELTTLLLRLDPYDNVKYAKIFDMAGALLQRYYGPAFNQTDQMPAPDQELGLESAPVGMSTTESELIALKLIGEERLPLGYALIVIDIRTPLAQSKQALFFNMLPLTLIVVALSIIVVGLLYNKMLSPLTRLSEFTRNVEQTKDYGLRIDIDGRNEVATLGHNINRMMATINNETEKNLKQTQQLLDQQKAMERLANFDSLTGLPNRQFIMENLRMELARARRGAPDVALMFFDLDGFKGVNDSLGHEVGDLLLVEVGERVKGHVREGDLVARLGGDEFLILLNYDPDELTLVKIANRIIKGLSQTFHINNWQINIGASIGIARGRDSDYDLHDFVGNADIAMYRSKMSGRGTYTIFAQEMVADSKRKLVIVNSIASAVKNNELELVYQGKVSPEERLIGFEALLRWNSPELGPVSPGEFIPIAEQSGKIANITRWMLERLCHDLPQVHATVGEKLRVSVNLSALDLKKPGLFEYIEDLLKTYQIDPVWLEFEVTESAYLENLEMANSFFQAASRAGCSIALDDFGTGYSSLSYLTQIRINTLKIDKQFVDNLGLSERDRSITGTIIDMGKRLQLDICAEGVETREQFEFLVENGCNQLQGYLFFKPVRLQDLSAQPGIQLAG